MEKSGFKFREVRKAKLDKLYLRVNFAGGDADTSHPEEYDLGIKYSEYIDHLEEIDREIGLYRTLQGILDVNSSKHCECYKEVNKKYGKDMAYLYDNVPNDPQSDYQFKCYIDSLELVGFDNEGNKYEAYIR